MYNTTILLARRLLSQISPHIKEVEVVINQELSKVDLWWRASALAGHRPRIVAGRGDYLRDRIYSSWLYRGIGCVLPLSDPAVFIVLMLRKLTS